MTFKHLSSLAALGLVMGLMGCQSAKTENDPVIVPAVVEPTRLEGHLESRSNTKTTGHVSLQPEGEMVLVSYEITGLKPRTRHGFHIHEKGDCSASDASSAGGHWNPTGHAHGGTSGDNRHLGDFGNIRANGKGVAKGQLKAPGFKLSDAKGLAVIVHGKADDEKTQPSGNSGDRIACGILQ